MSIIGSNILAGASGQSSAYNLNNSLRFRSSASAYLNRTLGTPTDGKLWTWSGWVKRGAIGSGLYGIQHAFSATNNQGGIYFNADALVLLDYPTSVNCNIVTTQVFRDPSAWYHIIVSVDTTQATASNRVKVYVNGSQVTAFSTATYPTQNTTLRMVASSNSGSIGRYYDGTSYYFDGYMTEVNFIDGQALTPSSFGETDTDTGSWKPKAYAGTYGTNGFYLKFSDIATTSGSNAGLGKDFSGNANYWTTNNISVTAGTTYDAMTDSPTLTSATVANYAVMNPLNSVTQATLADGNLNVSSTTAAWKTGISTIQLPTSGKWYFETTIGSGGVGNGVEIGLVSYDQATYRTYKSTGTKNSNTGGVVAYGASYTSSDIIGAAIDVDAGTIVFYKNNSSQGTAFSDIASAVPSSGWYLAIQANNSSNHAVNFGQRPFTYTPPSGFVRLNTFNLPDSTIKKGNTVMDATLYTGNGTTSNIVNAGGFKPDLVWMKNRGSAQDHTLLDSIRGTTGFLISNYDGAQSTAGDLSVSYNSNGFSAIGANARSNASSNTYVGWQWQAGQGSSSSNTSGTITSTVSVNATAGFSIVTYTGTGSAATIGHGLGVAPKMLIVKNRVQGTYGNWNVWHTTLTGSQYLTLNATDATSSNNNRWNGTVPTSTVFSVGTDSFGNTNKSGDTYVAYCWAEIAGFSKFGSYTGNFNADGPFIYTGFRPKFVLLKSSGDTGSWNLLDATRNPSNVANLRLFPNNFNAESTSTFVDFLSNGFKIRTSDSDINYTVTNIYMAFAENPFKNANAR